MSGEPQHSWSQAVFLGDGEAGVRASRSCVGLAGCRQDAKLAQSPGTAAGPRPGSSAMPAPRACAGLGHTTSAHLTFPHSSFLGARLIFSFILFIL